MVIKQVALEFTDDIIEGIASGKLFVVGSVVRDAAGVIVKHLAEVPLPKKSSDFDIARLAEGIKDPMVWIVVGIGVAVTTAVGLAVAASVSKKNENAKLRLPTSIDDYNTSLSAYLVAIHSGNIDAGIVDRLIAKLDALKADVDSGGMAVGVSTEQFESLLTTVREYTIKFAEANGVEVDNLDATAPATASESIQILRRYLETQKRIIDDAAGSE